MIGGSVVCAVPYTLTGCDVPGAVTTARRLRTERLAQFTGDDDQDGLTQYFPTSEPV